MPDEIRSYFLPGGGRGVLLLHGFTGTSDDMLYLGRQLNDAGYTVSIPLVSGHGLPLDQFEKATHTDWFTSSQNALDELAAECDEIFICGLSMGGLLTLRHAYLNGRHLKAIASLSTPFYLYGLKSSVLLPMVQYTPLRFIYRYGRTSFQDIKDKAAATPKPDWNGKLSLSRVYQLRSLISFCRGILPDIKTPVFISQSVHDHRTPFKSVKYLSKHIGSEIKQQLILKRSYHIITLDVEKDILSKSVIDFFDKFY